MRTLSARPEAAVPNWTDLYSQIDGTIAHIAAPGQIPRLLELAARFAGQLINQSEIGRTLGLDHKTVSHYLRVLEQVYLIERVQPWSRNELSRLVKTPKLHFIDSGLLAAMRGYSVARLRSDRNLLGPLLETFVFSELVKAVGWNRERVSIFHYRVKERDSLQTQWPTPDLPLESGCRRITC